MSERHESHHATHERPEAHHDQLEAARREKLEELRNKVETGENDPSEKRAEQAREVINRQEDAPKHEKEESAPAAPRHHVLFNPHLNYAETMASVQRKLTPASRAFSKVIHTPVLEKASESLEKTLARPSVQLGSTWTALVVGSVFYFTARTYGYSLSGSELVFSFIVGAVLGVLLEGLWRTLKTR